MGQDFPALLRKGTRQECQKQYRNQELQKWTLFCFRHKLGRLLKIRASQPESQLNPTAFPAHPSNRDQIVMVVDESAVA